MRLEYVPKTEFLVPGGGFVAGNTYQLGAPHEQDDPTYREVGSGAQVALDGTEERDIDYIETTWRVSTDFVAVSDVPIWLMALLSHLDGTPLVVDFASDTAGIIVQPQTAIMVARQSITPQRIGDAPLYRRFSFRLKMLN